MTFGEKLQDARKRAGLSQEQLAEKLSVSRSAVAKWENNNGMPDIDNLKAIAQLLDVSIDYLLANGSTLEFEVMREPIDINSFEKSKKRKSRYDTVVLSKFPDADSIIPLWREKKLSKCELAFEWILSPVFGVFDFIDQVDNFGCYYLIEKKGQQYLVNVSKEFVTSSMLARRINEKKFTIGKYRFKRLDPQELVEKV
ncbi:MAG TPA: helix-turn-helix transcriptional regulator [Clostridiaceae bacterium]|nr:helix-turn-helix transcriptional regulator [Clostridiaceae bacterium]